MPIVPGLFTGAQRGAAMPLQSDRAGAGFSAVGRVLGQGLRNLGQDLMQAGRTTAALVVQEQNAINENAARDANTQARIKMMQAWDSFSKLNGRAAVEAFPAYLESLKTIKETSIQDLPNDAAKRMAGDAIDSASLSFMQSGMTYRSQQETAWSQASVQASTDQAIADANLYRHDPATAGSFLDAGAREIYDRTIEVDGLDAATAAVKMAEYYGQGYKTVIANLAAEDPIAAQAVFEANRLKMDPVSQAQIADALKPKVLDAKADAIVASITTGAPTGEAALAAQFFVNQGWTPSQAAAIAGGLMQESGANLDPNASGDGGSAFGIAQWRGDRRAALEAFAAERGLLATDRLTQLMFVDHELRTSESAAGAKLRGAQTAEEAAAAFLDFERPQGWAPGGDPAAAHGWEQRLANTLAFGNQAMIDPTKPLDKNAMLARAIELAGGDQELARAAVTRVAQYISIYEAQTAAERAMLDQHVADVETALKLGNTDVTIPEADIRRYYPEAEANRMIGALKLAQIAGSMFKSVEFMAPADIEAQRADLESGTGAYSNMIKEAFGLQGVSDADDAAMKAATAAVTAEFDQAVRRRNEALAKDPAAYVLDEPTVKTARELMNRDRTPAAWNNYVVASLAQQERLGVLTGDQRVLTTQQAKGWIDSITNTTMKAGADKMMQLEQQTGEHWPRIFGELQEAGLPGELVALSVMVDPVARATLINAVDAEKTGGTGALRKTLGEDNAKSIDKQIAQGTADFRATFNFAENGITLSNELIKAVQLVAYALAPRLGADAAAQKAVSYITGMYDVVVDESSFLARAPKGMGDRMALLAEDLRDNLDAGDLMLRNDPTGVYSPEDRERATLDAAHKGFWVTSPDGMSWTLLTPTVDGSFDPVLRADGNPVTLSYEDAAKADSTSVYKLKIKKQFPSYKFPTQE